MGLQWPYVVFAVATVLTVPLYLAIMTAIWWRPKLTPFHVLTISQGIADIFFLLIYNFFTVLRASQLFNDFYWTNRFFLANASFITTYYTLYLRCIGITLISIQRYITVCLAGTKTEMIMMEIPCAVFVLLHWFSALPMTVPLMTSFDATYDKTESLDALVPKGPLAVANMISVISVIVLFLICFFCFVLVISHILRSRKNSRRIAKRHEIRLSIQFAGLLIAFLFVFVYSIGQYVLNETHQIDLLFQWRVLNPSINSFLSCVKPWMCVIFNKK